jgi:hypothetical protein
MCDDVFCLINVTVRKNIGAADTPIQSVSPFHSRTFRLTDKLGLKTVSKNVFTLRWVLIRDWIQ